MVPDTQKFWDVDHTWPQEVEVPDDDEDDLQSYLTLFRWMGYEDCATGDPEEGYLKIAVYSTERSAPGGPKHEFHHVARQLPSGKWSSKAGAWHDFQHELQALEGSGWYGRANVTHYLRRRDDGSDPLTRVAETGLLDPQGNALERGDHSPDTA